MFLLDISLSMDDSLVPFGKRRRIQNSSKCISPRRISKHIQSEPEISSHNLHGNDDDCFAFMALETLSIETLNASFVLPLTLLPRERYSSSSLAL